MPFEKVAHKFWAIIIKSLCTLLLRYLEACLDREIVRPQDVRTVLAVVASNPAGRLLAWRHLRAHWHTFQNMFGEGSFTMGSLITAVVAHFSNEFDYKEVSTISIVCYVFTVCFKTRNLI